MRDRWKKNRLLREIREIGKNICRRKGRNPGTVLEQENKVTYMEYAQVKKKSRKFKNESTQKLPFSLESNIEVHKEMVPECRAADIYYEKRSESEKYSFAYPLIVQNPYGLVPLSALIIFRTSEPCRIRYTVKGKDSGTDFVNEGNELRTRHRVPILGLYAGMDNLVVLERLDENGKQLEEKEFTIVTPALPERLANCVVKKKKAQNPHIHLSLYLAGILGILMLLIPMGKFAIS